MVIFEGDESMRKLKIQMQMTSDGFVAGLNGEMDWMTWDWDNDLKDYVTKITKSFDTILMGRKMTEGFCAHWEKIAKDQKDPEYEAAKIFVETPKIVFSRTVKTMKGKNVTVSNGDLKQEVLKLKKLKGKDLIAYGGAGFVSNLIKEDLIDDYYLFQNPVVIGKGMSIFSNIEGKRNLALVESRKFDCGIVVLHYKSKEEGKK